MLVEKTWWTDIKDPQHLVHIKWHDAWFVASDWNEACAKVLEVFGLPGHRYYYRPLDTNMMFIFKSVKDAALCRILLSELL